MLLHSEDVEFHKKLITGQYKFQLPQGVKQFFLVLLFSGVDCANAHTCFKSSLNDMKGISLEIPAYYNGLL